MSESPESQSEVQAQQAAQAQRAAQAQPQQAVEGQPAAPAYRVIQLQPAVQPQASRRVPAQTPASRRVSAGRPATRRPSSNPPGRDPNIPKWIYDLVPVANHARSILLRQLPLLAAGAIGALAFGWLAPRYLDHTSVQALGALLLLGCAVAVLNTAQRSTPAEPLPKGGRTGVHLLLLDIVLTGLGLMLLGGLALAGARQLVLLASMAVLGGAVGSLFLLLLDLPARSAAKATAIVLLLSYLLAIWFFGPLSWWTAGVVAVAVDVAALLAASLGRREPARPR
ncbi:Uncharacterised protein [Actinomyces bovis]|uniref:Acid-resistance membrane protein n=1 Tax=Actinomyces bovis TaxID=1658 RepID=A0ABY1VSR0_9ACTO|nr:hypothetical protein [Actinomyces bovis]SPT54447.1 Uncharacterised protein [Actinomyces bovis]VEG55944.1 Uncharacterised protein [Actinomyces israelii]